MPTIPRYQQSVPMPTVTGGVIQPVREAGVTGRAMQQAGGDLQQLGTQMAEYAARLQRQKEDSQLIEVGAKLNDAFLQWEQQYKETNKGISATGYMQAADEFVGSLMKEYLEQAPSERWATLVKQHILTKGIHVKTSLAGYASEELKKYHTAVRTQDLVTSVKEAQAGRFNEALQNYTRTLDAQLMNGTISDAEYQTLRMQGADNIADAYIMSRDPVARKTAFELLKEHLLPTTITSRQNEIAKEAALTTGKTIGDQIFEKGGSLTEQYKAVAAMNIDPATAKAAETRIAERHHLAEEDKRIQERDAMERFYTSVMPKVEQRGMKIMLPSDLSGPEWEAYKRVAPDNAAKLAEHVQVNVRQLASMETRARSEALQAKRMEQNAIEVELMSRPDLYSVNLFDYDLRPEQIRRLTTMKERMDPTKRASVKAALDKIQKGNAMREALGITDKNEIASWQLKYSDLVREFAVKHYQDPDFDEKLNDYVEKHILSDVFMKWVPFYRGFHREKYEKARQAIGAGGQAPATSSATPALSGQPTATRPGENESLRNMAIAAIKATPGVPLTERNIQAAMEQLRSYTATKVQRRP